MSRFPAVREYRHGYATALTIQAIVLIDRGKREDAVRALDAARGALTRLTNDYPESGEYPESLVSVLHELARTYRALGRADAATRADEEADALEGKTPKARP